jgi:hypothetical protein
MIKNRQINHHTVRRPRHGGALQNLEGKAGRDKMKALTSATAFFYV